jgi:hypothetical protein
MPYRSSYLTGRCHHIPETKAQSDKLAQVYCYSLPAYRSYDFVHQKAFRAWGADPHNFDPSPNTDPGDPDDAQASAG